MAGALLDTDVFVGHLRGARRLDLDPADAAYSTLTRAELYAGRGSDEATIDDLLEPFVEFPVDRAVAEEGGRIRRRFGVSLPDAIVAATALLHDRTLMTRNVRDFRQVAGVRLAEPP